MDRTERFERIEGLRSNLAKVLSVALADAPHKGGYLGLFDESTEDPFPLMFLEVGARPIAADAKERAKRKVAFLQYNTNRISSWCDSGGPLQASLGGGVRFDKVNLAVAFDGSRVASLDEAVLLVAARIAGLVSEERVREVLEVSKNYYKYYPLFEHCIEDMRR